MCNSPRARAGLSILPASIAPSDFPAPTSVCSSSRKRMISPEAVRISSSTALRRSSNSPRNFAPASSAPKSNDINRLLRKLSGTSPFTMRCANPSIMAVLPTPGSPIKTGLFFVRLDSTCTVRLISSSRPITGSSLPSRAMAVKSCAYLFKASNWSSAVALSAVRPLRRELTASFNWRSVTPASSR